MVWNGNDESIDASSSIRVGDMRQEVSKAGGMSTERFHLLVRVNHGALNKGKADRPQGRLAHQHEHVCGCCFEHRADITSAPLGWNPTEKQGLMPFCSRSKRGLDCCSYSVSLLMMCVCCRSCCRSCPLDPIGSCLLPSSSGEGENNVREKKCPEPEGKKSNQSTISSSALTSNELCALEDRLPG